MTALTTSIEQAETLTVIGETLRPLLTNEMGSPIEVYDTSGDDGMGPPPHHHPWDEIYVMVEGQLDVMIGDEAPQRLTRGMAALAPAGTIHGYRIAADGTRFLTIMSRGNAYAFFRQMDAEVSMPPQIEDVVRVAAGHGISFPS